MNAAIYLFQVATQPVNIPLWSLIFAIGIQTFVLATFLGRLFQRVDGLSATATRHGQEIDDLHDGQNDLKIAGVQLSTIIASKMSNPHPDPQISEVINRFKDVGTKRRRAPEAT
jgi:hypothetical protein